MSTEIYDDVWIPTACCRCYSNCAIRVHRMNGVAVQIEGNPDTAMGGAGGLCGKGVAGLQVLYDPNRLNVPLRRTNPEKGLFVDPKWKEITWDEALDEIAEKLGKILADDPGRVLWAFTTIRPQIATFGIATFGGMKLGNYFAGGGGLHCGNGAHEVAGIVHGAWSLVPDFKYCNYAIYFGASKGHGAGHSSMITARLAAEARSRGMKLIVFDPMCNFAGGKATEWIPLIPGTDGAVALAMCNVIVNELGIWDEAYIKLKSNSPYLIGADQRYVRDKETNKPQVWDAVEGKAKVYDDSTTKDYALEGMYEVHGAKCQPAFQLVKEYLKQYTLEMASKASTVPAETIHRIAVEFAQAACVGSSITIDGHQLLYRPASAVIFRGGEGHQNSMHTCFAVSLLNQIVGACDVPGGTLGWPARGLGYPATGKIAWSPYAGVDGILQTQNFGPSGTTRWPPPKLEELEFAMGRGPWPPHLPELQHHAGLRDIFPLGLGPFAFVSSDQEELWQKVGLRQRFEMMVAYGCNLLLSVASRDSVAEALKKIPFIVVFELFNTELTEGFADIVLPDTCYLEETSVLESEAQNFNYPFGSEDWCYHIIQPVVKPGGSRRSYIEVMWALMDKLGRREELNRFINYTFGFEGDNKFGPNEKFNMEQLADRVVKNLFGPEHDWEWFKKHGFISWPKKVEESYWRYFVDARTPIYLEHMVDIGERFRKINEEIDLGVDCSQYTPFISWTPCSIHQVDKPGYDLYCFSYRDVLHTGSSTMEQPWIEEASGMNPYTYNITMNRDTAMKKGLKEGDIVEIESVSGRKVQGTLKLIQGQHPQTMGIAACSGHWAKGLPIAKGKGTNFDNLLEIDLKHVDPVSMNLETCVRVKVRKVKGG